MSKYRSYLFAGVVFVAGCIVYLSNNELSSRFLIMYKFMTTASTAANRTVAESEISGTKTDSESNVNSDLSQSGTPMDLSLLLPEKRTEHANLSSFSSLFMLDLNSVTHNFNPLVLSATDGGIRKRANNLTNNLHLKRNLTTKQIYFYNKPEWFRRDLSGCVVDACEIVIEPDLLEKADAMLVHVPQIMDSRPPTRPQGQIWIGFGLEPPHQYYDTYKNPAWRGVFNWSMTYRVDSDVFIPYSYITYKGPTTPERNYTSIALGKTKTAAWVVSNCRTPSGRMQYVNKLRQYIDVDIFGACGSITCSRGNEEECLTMLNMIYAFYIAFENSLCLDYVTEKFYNAFYFNVDVIPVVRGGANYKKYFPTGTFIDAEDFKGPADMGKYLKSLLSDHEAYAAMLRRKDHFSAVQGNIIGKCDLCKKLHEDKEVKMYRDFPDWLESGMCRLG